MNWTDALKLIGIAIIVLGLALRLRTTIVVVTAGLVTGVIAGIPLLSSEGLFQDVPYLTRAGEEGIINMLGRAFTDFRQMTLFIITLPAIGLAERHGLQEQSARWIRRIKAATVGKLLIIYQLFRALTGLLGLRLNGHPSFVRPLILPMSLGAAEAMAGAKSVDELSEVDVERIKAAGSAAENYGNFYGQNLLPVQTGIQLVSGIMNGLGYTVNAVSLVYYTIPIVVFSIVLGAVQFFLLDRHYRKKARAKS